MLIVRDSRKNISNASILVAYSSHAVKRMTAQEAVKVIQSGDRVYVHEATATPKLLVEALTDRASELTNVEVMPKSPLTLLD